MFKPPKQAFITANNWDYYQRHCRGKKKYKAMWQIEAAKAALLKLEPEAVFEHYICNFCTLLHVGHSKSVPRNGKSFTSERNKKVDTKRVR